MTELTQFDLRNDDIIVRVVRDVKKGEDRGVRVIFTGRDQEYDTKNHELVVRLSDAQFLAIAEGEGEPLLPIR